MPSDATNELPASTTACPTDWAIVIGVNDYENPPGKLLRAVEDALLMRDWLVSPSGGGIQTDRLSLLLASESKEPASLKATFDAIVSAFQKLEGERGRRLFVYFAGHGISEPKKHSSYEQILIPTDCSPKQPKNALPLSEILEFCAHLSFPEQIFVIDACRTPWPENLNYGRFSFPPTGKPTHPHQFVLSAVSPDEDVIDDGKFASALLRGLSKQGATWNAKIQKLIVTFSGLHLYLKKELPVQPWQTVSAATDPILAIYDAPLPRRDCLRFSVAVAQFENDPQHELETLLVDQLGQLRPSVEIQQLQRPLYIPSTPSEERLQAARAQAQNYVDETGIDGLIWGERLSLGGEIAARLYFTRSTVTARPDHLYPIREFTLPKAFWRDLADFLCLLLKEQAINVDLDRFWEISPEQVQGLNAYIQRVKMMVLGERLGPEWSADDGALARSLLASALMTSSECSSLFGTGSLLENEELTARLLEEAVQSFTREREFERESSLGNLAIVYDKLGRLEEAVNIFRRLKELWSTADALWLWIGNQLNLGHALVSVADRHCSRSRAARYDEAAEEFEKAAIRCDIGTDYWIAARVGQSVALNRSALSSESEKERLKRLVEGERYARDAFVHSRLSEGSMSGLGAAHIFAVLLSNLGKYNHEPHRLFEAISLLLYLCVSDAPGGAKINYKESLCNALSRLGEQSGEAAPIREALLHRSTIIPALRANNDKEGIRLGQSSAGEDIRLLVKLDPELIPWLKEYEETLGKIDPELIKYAHYLLSCTPILI